MNRRLSSVRIIVFLFIAAIWLTSPKPICQAQSVEIPDTPAGKRLVKLLEYVSLPDKKERDAKIVTLFTDEDDPAELRETADVVYDQTGGISVIEVRESKNDRIKVIAKTQKGPLLEIQLQVTKTPDQLIKNLHFGRYDEKKVAKQIGDLLPVLDKDGNTLPAARGTWLAKGYGFVAHITENDIAMYDYTGKYGWKFEDDDESDLLFKLGKSPDHGRMTYHPKEPGYNLVRMESLPQECQDETAWTQTRLFDLFANIMTTHYPFFAERNVDWQSKIEAHRPSISDTMTDTELFDVMEEMLSDLNDGHTGLHAEIDGEERRARTGHSKTIRRLRAAYEALPEPKSKNKFFNSFRRNIDDSIMIKALGGKGQKSCANKIKWGHVHANVGYINISGMGGYSLGDTDTQVKVLHESLNEILTALADTQAIIVDISMNGGGSDLYSIEIASHFADKKRLGFSKWPAAAKEYRQDRYVTPYDEIDEGGVIYTKPVYLLTNDYTGSAAEIFTMCMRAMPHVTTVGTATSGALSDVLDKSLPNGWNFHTSNEVYVDHEGVCYEGPGIPPAIPIDVFDPKDIVKVVHHETIQKVVELALSQASEPAAAGK